MYQEEKPILFSEMSVGGYSIGVIELNRPRALNALNTECYGLIEHKLFKWAKNSDIAAVVILGKGDKAFCAGGDVKTLAFQIQNKNTEFIKNFFTHEYFVDCFIHHYPKPVVAFAEGITMGGGLGLMNGASHRIVTENTIIAMPEVAIGLFPDVGATRFLNNCPNHFGLFMGLTGSRVTGADAVSIQLADYFMPAHLKRKVLADLMRLPWQSDSTINHEILDKYFLSIFSKAPEPLRFNEYLKSENIFSHSQYFDILDNFSKLKVSSPFMKEAQDRFFSGSPTAKQVFFDAYYRNKNLKISEALVVEWTMAINFSNENEFYEGVRATLIDKDSAPKWSPSQERDVAHLERFYKESEKNDLASKVLDLDHLGCH